MKFADEALLRKARIVGQDLLRKMNAEELAAKQNKATASTTSVGKTSARGKKSTDSNGKRTSVGS